MKKLLYLSLFTAVMLSQTAIYSQYSNVYLDDKKKAYQEFLKNHEYKNRPHYTKEELKAIPKKDRPDLANELNFLQTMDPATGTVPYDKLIQAHKTTDYLQAQNKTAIPGITWTERGPNNFGGRTRALMWDPNDGTGKTVFAGGVAGGLWKNTDITNSSTQWVAIDDFWDNIAITALAYDPSNTQIMYAGTGEGFYNVDAVYGGGIWKSTDGGTSWTRLSSTSSYIRITRIVVTNAGHVYASTNGSGIIRSTNGGSTWSTVLSSTVGGAAEDRAGDIQIGADQTLYAGMGIMWYAPDGIYSSSDGTTWTKLNTGSNGFPTTDIRRIEIACAPSNANVIYAVVQDGGSDIKGIYKTTNKGTTWTSLTLPVDAQSSISPDFTRGQAWYDLSIEVDPNDANTLFVGGIDLFKSTNGGSSWTQMSHWYGGFGYQYVHADQHAAVYKPGSSTEIIFGHDGGVSYCGNANTGSPTISERNNGYNVTQFYAAAINGTSGSNNMLAGAQDNGTHKFNNSGINSTTEVTGGDGAFCQIDQSNGNNQISQYVYNVIYRTTSNWTPINSHTTLSNDQTTGLFINPSDYDDKEDIYYSGFANGSSVRLKRIINPFGSTSNSTIVIASGSDDVSHISCSPHSSAGNSTVFVGTDGGDVYKISNAQSGSPTITNIGSGLPAGNISCIAIGASEQQLLVTLSNYNTVSVWETTNGGTNWINKDDGTSLPNMPVRWAMYNPFDYTQAFLATEVGVWSTDDLTVGSVDWSPTNNGLANCRTDMLQYRSSDRTIVAATHGRGLFTTVIPLALPPVAEFSGTPTTICVGDSTEFTDASTNTPTSWAWSFSPATVTYINSTTSSSQNPVVRFNAAGNYTVTLTATNAAGSDQEIKTNYITVNDVPGNAGTITGSTSVCENATGIGYSISAVTGATSYNWIVPSGASITGGQGTTSITVTFGTSSGNVTVTPINSCGNGGSNNLAVTVNVCGSAPVAEFSGTPTTICVGDSTEFTDASTNTPTSWAWSFNPTTVTYINSTTSSSQNPVVRFNASGNYTVTLTATNAFGSDPEIKTNYITVNDIPGNAGSITGSTSVCENASGIGYSISAVSGATNYTWSVPSGAVITSGQGSTSITVTFGTNSGNVSVTPSNSCGNGGSNNLSVSVTSCSGAPVAQFDASPKNVCVGSTVSFTDFSTNNPTGWSWSFPGGTPSSSNNQNPTITYNSVGTYSVTLTASNASGSDIETKTAFINVLPSTGGPLDSTQIRAVDCGITLNNGSSIVYADAVPNGIGYQFKVTNTTLGFSYEGPWWTGRYITLMDIPGILPNTTYDIQVRARTNRCDIAYYGPTCQVTTPSNTVKVTYIRNSQCGSIVSSSNTPIYAITVNGADRYDFEFSNSSLGYNQTQIRWGRYVTLNNFTGLQANTTYDVRVRARVNGVLGPYNKVCQITTPSSLKLMNTEIFEKEIDLEEERTPLEMVIYPNPSQGEFIYLDLMGLQANSELIVTDISGKVIQQQYLESDETNYNSTIRFNDRLSSGFYLITVVSGQQKVTKKLIVR